MTRRFSFLTSRSLLTVAAILQVTPHSVSGGVGSSHHASQAQPQSQAATILATVNNTSDKGNPNPGIHPINSKPYGLSYSEWSARWWQWLLQIPAATNPNLDATGANCAEGQSGHVWFLAGSFGPLTISFPINRFCTVPTGISFLLPVLNQADGAALLDCAGPAPFDVPCADFSFNGKTGLAALREEAKVSQDNPSLLQLSLDGLPLSDISAYRVQSPVFKFHAQHRQRYQRLNDDVWLPR